MFSFSRITGLYRWVFTFITGLWCGCIALLIHYFTHRLTQWKFTTLYHLIETEKSSGLPYGTAFLFYVSSNLLLISIAWFTVYIEPLSAGSGIPEIKCYLNGLNIPRIVRLKTMICKAVGIIFAVASGLPLGKEGPMVHIGAIVAAGVSQGKSTIFGINTAFSKYQDFRNDKEKRDFVACGAAAGGKYEIMRVVVNRWSSCRRLRQPHRRCAVLTRGGLLLLVHQTHLAMLLLRHGDSVYGVRGEHGLFVLLHLHEPGHVLLREVLQSAGRAKQLLRVGTIAIHHDRCCRGNHRLSVQLPQQHSVHSTPEMD